VKLKSATPPRWLTVALAGFDAVLVDHAHCEKKAAANALSLLQVYPDVPGLPAQMARLAREESAHLAKVLALMEERGLQLGRDAGDPYAKGLQELLRNGQRERRLDRLLVAGIIESRSHERLALLAEGLADPKLRRLYAELARSEDGHQKLFVRLAKNVEEAAVVDARLDALLDAEAALLAQLPVRAAIH
jgi:tRNA 2-(methylsulfanyl)-N6-isopentenyladenosine37 hydroxylase